VKEGEELKKLSAGRDKMPWSIFYGDGKVMLRTRYDEYD